MEVQFENLFTQANRLTQTSDLAIEQLKATLVDCCYRYRRDQCQKRSILNRKHLDSLKELWKNKDIIISRPDKGAGIVLMNKADYITKMEDILSDTRKFIVDNKADNTAHMENQLTDCLKRLKKDNIISEWEFDLLKPTGSQVP